MASIRPGNQAALLVVDVQVGVVANAWEAPRVIDRVAHAVDRARAQGVPVVWVQHDAPDLPRDSDAWQWVPALQPADGETRVYKQHGSAFEDTPLEEVLQAQGVTHLVLAGACTNWCIRATAYGALDRGYDLTLLKDAHTTECTDLGDGTRLEAAPIIADLNLAMTWLSYPGRQTGTATAAAVDFAQPGGMR